MNFVWTGNEPGLDDLDELSKAIPKKKNDLPIQKSNSEQIVKGGKKKKK